MDKTITIVVIESSKDKKTKLQSILGSAFLVYGTNGHLRDLKAGPLAECIDIDDNFRPTYEIIPRQAQITKQLKTLYKQHGSIIIASDIDREGEAIASGIAEILKLKNPKRMVLPHITKSEVEKAIKATRDIDYNLVRAQEARRILDIVAGYMLSPIVCSNAGGKSAGRVQSVVTRLICDRERDVKESIRDIYYKISGEFKKDNTVYRTNLYKLLENGPIFRGTICHFALEENQSADTVKKEIINLLTLFKTTPFVVHNVFNKMSTRSPNPPFMTSSLQQEAGRKFGFTVKMTMDLAQKLYENGYITYMRTDSVDLSAEAIDKIKKYVVDKYGADYHLTRKYKNKSMNAQEAHECIRCTEVSRETIDMDYNHQKLYELILRRTIASQMADAQINTTTIQIRIEYNKGILPYYFETRIDKTVFEGFLKVYNIQDIEDENSEDENKTDIIPPINSILTANIITATEEFSKSGGRYNETSLIHKMEKLGIGRPGTVSQIIEKIVSREYVKKMDIAGEKRKINIINLINNNSPQNEFILSEETREIMLGKELKKFVPTALGINVTNYLMTNFSPIMDYQFTSNMEKLLDDVASGERVWHTVVRQFYDVINPICQKLSIKTPESKLENLGRLLGDHPDTDMKIYAGTAKFGPVVKLCKFTDTKQAVKIEKYAPIKEPLTIDTITINDAIELLKYPYNLGKYDKKMIVVQRGQYGYYLKYNGKNYGLDKVSDTALITLEYAIKTIEQKEKSYNEVKYDIKTGKFGLYICVTDKGIRTNVKIPADIAEEDMLKLTNEQMQEIIKQSLATKKPYAGKTTGKKPRAKPAKITVVKNKKT
ncbi:MAG: topoisomerase I [Faunusvirus sp.]|jgi:DNA topoisomerase-1|uniref:DNA topoisomerase n=1 Tax=Faunusvirus sp. TaxID=2487766 RepID=A0A3G4ZY33_9VIRU|nr:MAG: topoisomerase I [Faunusvirus sp.]